MPSEGFVKPQPEEAQVQLVIAKEAVINPHRAERITAPVRAGADSIQVRRVASLAI